MRSRTELWLVRHAESTGNRDNIIQGQEDRPLSPLGLRQSRALADRLFKAHRRTPFTAIYTSDLIRARETADAAALALSLKVICDRRLREIDVGTWGGLTTAQIAERMPDEWAAWQGRCPTLRRGGGESYQDAHDRITPAINELAEQHAGQRVLVVTHGGVMRAYVAGLIDLDLVHVWHFSIGNTAICRVRPFETAIGGSTPRTGRLLCLNDCAHAEDVTMRSGEF